MLVAPLALTVAFIFLCSSYNSYHTNSPYARSLGYHILGFSQIHHQHTQVLCKDEWGNLAIDLGLTNIGPLTATLPACLRGSARPRQVALRACVAPRQCRCHQSCDGHPCRPCLAYRMHPYQRVTLTRYMIPF